MRQKNFWIPVKAAYVLMMVFAIMFVCVYRLNAVTVTGIVAGSDNPTVGLPDAVITLAGTNTYTAITNVQGVFTIPNVEGNTTYAYQVTHDDYSPATGNINVPGTDLNMGTIILNEIAPVPTNIVAELNTGHTAVNISWLPPEPTMPVWGYKIWRLTDGNEQNEQTWVLLTPTMITPTEFVDNNWLTLPQGVYKWAVKAVFDQNVLSLAAFSNALPTTTGIESDTVVMPALFTIYPNPASVSATIKYSLTASAFTG